MNDETFVLVLNTDYNAYIYKLKDQNSAIKMVEIILWWCSYTPSSFLVGSYCLLLH